MITLPVGFITGTDPSAQAFIDAAGNLSNLEKAAINTLVKSLKETGIWSKLHAAYPFVGGTASSCALNLINPTDTYSTINFTGSWTFNSYGIEPVNTSSFADTGWYPYTFINNRFYYRYVNGIGSENCGYDGSATSGGSPYVSLGRCSQLEWFDGGVAISNGGAPGSGFAQAANRTSGSSTQLWRELTASGGTPWGIYTTDAASEGTLPTSTYSIVHMNTLNNFYTLDRNGFYAFGYSLTTGGMNDFHAAVSTFCTTLGRNY